MKALIKYIPSETGAVDTIKVVSFEGIETHIKVVGNSREEAKRDQEFYETLTELVNESFD